MIKEDVQSDVVAMHEFDVEHGILSRLNHPNIVQLRGAGHRPRRFLVLEYMEGGSLQTILMQNQAKPGLAQKLFRKPTFTYANLLLKARDIAEAFMYLHEGVADGVSIIHRDLKVTHIYILTTLRLFRDFTLFLSSVSPIISDLRQMVLLN
jgi:serine/threonine protein kinase